MQFGYAASAGEKDIFDAIKYASENGFSSVELNVNMPIFFPENFTLEQRKEVAKYKLELGVDITLHAPEDLTLLQLQKSIRKATMERFKEVLDFAGDIGASRVTMHVGPAVCFTLTDRKSYLDEIYYDEYKDILKSSLNELADYSAGKTMLCIENSGRFPERLVQDTLEEVLEENKNLFLTWDIGHSYKNEYNEVQFFEKHVDRIKTCHVHDNNGKSDHQIIGEGGVDFTKHFDLMGKEGVSYIIEVRPRENALKSLKKLEVMLGS
jgi:sugar phosphate isomerase/epimerase